MHRKTVLFIQEGMTSYERYTRVVASLDADLKMCPVGDFGSHLREVDAIIHTVSAVQAGNLSEFERMLINSENTAALFIVDEEALKLLRMPTHIPADFALSTASDDEITVRLRHLLWPSEETASADFINVDSMTINLSTYQVQVDGEPVDFTYLEYALLAFLVSHPGHAYSRDALLRRVWGFDYYGGSRTVDVHVRRVRAKLGTELAARLETVRGVGYMWNM